MKGTARARESQIENFWFAIHVIPAKLVLAKAGSGNAGKWAPASARATPLGTFVSMGGPQW